MNKDRRNRIADAISQLEEAKGIIEECKDEEQEYYDNMPESFQQGDKGSTAENNVSELESSEYAIENAVSELESIIQNIDDAISSAENGQE